MSEYHTSVLLQQAVGLLNIQPGQKYIDATLGGGGHTFEIIYRGGKVLGIDRDEEAVAFVESELKNQHLVIPGEGRTQEVRLLEKGGSFGESQSTNSNRRFGMRPFHKGRNDKKDIILVKGNFKDIDKIAKKNGFTNISGILFDLGVSTHQLDTPERGFSLNKSAKLDMRMDRDLQVSAYELINGLTQRELTELFWKFGEERFARQIAKRIVARRKQKVIDTTDELAHIVLSIRHRSAGDRTHPATRIFQALRIVVNDELQSLRDALPKALNLLQPAGRLSIISFHSLEDRIVKEQFQEWDKKGFGRNLTKKPIVPGALEVGENPRSRSAKLRGFEKENLRT